MGNKNRGLYDKFFIERTDGSSKEGGKHHGCEYFILDLDHDPHSITALRAYAESCKNTYPLLSKDLLEKIKDKASKLATCMNCEKPRGRGKLGGYITPCPHCGDGIPF